jgi:hypothetical protein
MNKYVWIALTIGLWLGSLITWDDHCARAWFSYGIAVDGCPVGVPRQTAVLEAVQLRRGIAGPGAAPAGSVTLQAIAHYTTGDADDEQRAPVLRMSSVALSLTQAPAASWPIAVDWQQDAGEARAHVTLPEVPDGNYQLHASYETRLGKGEVALPLALYAPARIHVITDRPLYEPGNTVRFRAVVLRASDLSPLDHRPGVWVVRDPAGEVLLEEAAPAGEWGVVAGSFPLDKGAPTGAWKVAWRSADASDEVPFTVEPFTLPRFRVDAIASKPFYQPGDRPSIKGSVIYSSGAPVAAAALDITWQVSGAWPPPTDWLTTGLPRRAQTRANGRFELALPQIPEDLQGTATLTARISAVDPAGDRVEGAVAVLLSKDAIQVSAVTELGEGLVESFNNRLYLRVATPDGRVVANTRILVKRAWQPRDPGIAAQLDEDGVASLQLDPGAPVNIVIPAVPWRPAPRPALVSRGEPRELIGDQGAPLADQVELDHWLAALATCAKWVDGDAGTAAIKLGLRVDAAGTVIAAGAGPSALDRCAAAVAKQQRLPAGAERLYALDLSFLDPGLPRLVATLDSALDAPAGLDEQLAEVAKGARDCLPASEGKLSSLLSWRVRAGGKLVELAGWLPDPAVTDGRAALACVTSQFERAAGRALMLAEPAPSDAMGLVRFAVELPADASQARPQPTTMLGYELEVIATPAGADAGAPAGQGTGTPAGEDAGTPGGQGTGTPAGPGAGTLAGEDGGAPAGRGAARPAHTLAGQGTGTPAGQGTGKPAGQGAGRDGRRSTTLRVPPGTVPDLRMRVTPVLAGPGDRVTAQLIRGPRFTGKLPEKLALDCLKHHVEAPLDGDHRATLAIAADTSGWCTASGGGVRALVYVRPQAQLTVSVIPGRERYAPGDKAELAIQTTLGGKPGPAAVGLFGVDDSLGQLVPLPGADALARLRPQVETSAPAFGVLDGQALALGQIRGANAAAATVLRVSSIPSPPELDVVAGGRTESVFDPIEELTDRFYVALAELHAQVHAWEATAPAAEKMTAAKLAQLWSAALDACAARGARVDDAYGRRLRLARLPADLLSLTDPRAVVVVGTRLPEDVENWPAWVAKERP